jgi:hypothetical protein
MIKQINQVRTSTLFRWLFKTSNLKEFMKKNADEIRLRSFGVVFTVVVRLKSVGQKFTCLSKSL